MDNQTFATSATPVALVRHTPMASPAPHSPASPPHLVACFQQGCFGGDIPKQMYRDNGASLQLRHSESTARRLGGQATSTRM